MGAVIAPVATALALALSLASLVTRQTMSAALLATLQTLVVAVAVAGAMPPWMGLPLLGAAVALLLMARTVAERPAIWGPPIYDALDSGEFGLGPVRLLLLAGAGVALATTLPRLGPAFGVLVLGLVLLAVARSPYRQALGAVAVQNGLALSAIAGRSTVPLSWLAVLPVLPALAFAALWLGAGNARMRAWLTQGAPVWIDAGTCGLALLLSLTLPSLAGQPVGLWLLRPGPLHLAILLCAIAAARGWAQRDRPQVWASHSALLGGTVLAVVAASPALSWAGLLIAAIAACIRTLPARVLAWQRLLLGLTGVALVLFGLIAHASGSATLGTIGIAIIGYGAVSVLAPELAIAGAGLTVRLHSAGDAGVLLWLGLGGMATALLVLALHAGATRVRFVGLTQASVAVFAFGLNTTQGNFAGILQLTLLALSECAVLLASEDGADAVAALAGLAGLPPFGVFASLTLIAVATAATAPLLLLPLLVGIGSVAWLVLCRLPPGRAFRRSLAWMPLLLSLAVAFAMPAPLLAWFRLATP